MILGVFVMNVEMLKMTLPCKECISYAICNSRDEISCSILYDYFLHGGANIVDHLYASPQSDRLNEISKFFSRIIEFWHLTTEKPFFIPGTPQAMVITWSNRI